MNLLVCLEGVEDVPRIARIKKGEYCTYHVIQRGNERKNIFLDDKDKVKFLDTLARTKGKFNCKVYAYCLMNNHVHLVIDTNGSDISQLMKSLNVSYVMYFNRKYERCGHLFQDRFKSEIIDNDQYLLEVSRYIHLNPVRAKIVKNAADYPWSSYLSYIGRDDNNPLADTSLILHCFSDKEHVAVKKYLTYMNRSEERKDEAVNSFVLDFPDTENEGVETRGGNVLEILDTIATENSLTVADLISKRTPHLSVRNAAIKLVKGKCNLGMREIGSLFGGLSESAVSKIIKG